MSSWVEPHGLPTEPYEHRSAIGLYFLQRILKLFHVQIFHDTSLCLSVFRTFWSIFLVTGLTAVAVGGFVVICAAPGANHKLYKVGGSLQLCGGNIDTRVICRNKSRSETFGFRLGSHDLQKFLIEVR